MISIKLVKVGNVLIGQTASDRWNLKTLGLTHITVDRNQTYVKRLRRWGQHNGFAFTTIRNGSLMTATADERAALTRENQRVAA